MKNLISVSLYIMSILAWTVIRQLMDIITSKNSIITKESLNERAFYKSSAINEKNANTLKDVLRGV